MKYIFEELRDLKGRESQREKENKKLREEVEKIVEINKKYSDEIRKKNLRKRTQVKDVYALGDMIHNTNKLTGKLVYAPYGDVADKQAIVLAKHLAGKELKN